MNYNKAILITGASSGIGRAIAEYLSSKGFKIYAGARKNKDLDALNKLVNITAVRLDVTNQEEINSVYNFIKSQDWTLLEMHKVSVSLEDVFRNLTKEGGKK